MARRVVIFDAVEKPGVVVRRAKAASSPQSDQPVKTMDAARDEPGKKAKQPKKTPAAKMENRAAQKNPTESMKKIFLEKYLASARDALEHARELEEDESRPDREYYRVKREFLERIIPAVEQGNVEELGLAMPSEPFFWNELKRVSQIIYNGPKIDTPRGKKVTPAWRKSGNGVAILLGRQMDHVRLPRDGYKLNTPPILLRDVVFYVNGTMLYLEKQIAENPDREDLRKLIALYKSLYKKSGMKNMARKLAQMIEKGNRYNIWKNRETLNYLIENELKKEEENIASCN